MSEQPEDRTKDSGKAARDSIEQPEPVTVGSGRGSSGREGKGSGGAQSL